MREWESDDWSVTIHRENRALHELAAWLDEAQLIKQIRRTVTRIMHPNNYGKGYAELQPSSMLDAAKTSFLAEFISKPAILSESITPGWLNIPSTAMLIG